MDTKKEIKLSNLFPDEEEGRCSRGPKAEKPKKERKAALRPQAQGRAAAKEEGRKSDKAPKRSATRPWAARRSSSA